MKSIQQLLPAHIVEAIGASLMHSLWQFAALALLLILALAVLPQRAARLRYGFAIGTLTLMLAMPFATFGFLHEAPVSTEIDAGSGMHFATFQMPNQLVQHAPAALSISEKVTGFFQSNAYLLLGLWLIGVALLSIRFFGSSLQIRRLRKSGLQDVPQELAERFVQLMNKVGIRKQVKLRFSNLVDSPVVIGVFKPMILLPMGLLSGLSMEQVECILIHELAHIRRWDYLVNMLQSFAEILFFYHPATWWVNRLIRQERENCCDEIVVQLNGNKVQYAHALLNLEVLRQKPASLAMAANGGNLFQRIQRITGGNIVKKQKLHLRGFLFGLLTLVCIGLLATQSHTVIKAAIPFFSNETPAENDDFSANPPQDNDQESKKTDSKILNTVSEVATTETMPLDTPTTKVVVVDGDEEIELFFKPNGEILSGKRNGKAIPQEELAQYGSQTQSFFRGAAPIAPQAPSISHAGKMPPIPALPPLPAFGHVPPMPPMPAMGKVPPMPKVPVFDENTDPKVKEKKMKAFEKEMEAWGENFGKQFENGDWDAYGKEMEAWGEEFGKKFEDQDWEKFGQDWEKWGENFAMTIESADWDGFGENISQWAEAFVGTGKGEDSPEQKALIKEIEEVSHSLENAKSEKERERLEDQLDMLTDRLEAFEENRSGNFERNMEAFGTKMEAWAEQFANKMEQISEIEIAKEEANTRRLDREAQMEAEKAEVATREIGEALHNDGLIKKTNSYKLEIDKSEMRVNGKKQSEEIHRKYLEIVSDKMGVDVKKEGVAISLDTK